jgi:hypothetical protein
VAKDIGDDTKRVQEDYFVKEKLQTPELKSSDNNLERLLEVIHLNRKRKSVGMDSDASAIIASKDTCMPIADAIALLPSGDQRYNLAEKCGTCFKRQRYLFARIHPLFLWLVAILNSLQFMMSVAVGAYGYMISITSS